jgi:hypothetical protein
VFLLSYECFNVRLHCAQSETRCECSSSIYHSAPARGRGGLAGEVPVSILYMKFPLLAAIYVVMLRSQGLHER